MTTHTRCNRLTTHGPRRKLPTLSLLFAAALSVALVTLPPGASAANTWHVSPNSAGACTVADPNCATIQAAVTAASSGDTIQVAAGSYAEHVTISKDLTINGAGAAQTVVDGMQSGTVFFIISGTVSLSGMTVTNGDTSLYGGGINNSGVLTVINCVISNNSASNGGGIINTKTATITNSVVSGNFTTDSSGAGGGVFNSTGTLNVSGSTFSNNSINKSINSSGLGGGICNANQSTLNVNGSTFDNNLAGFGGGIYNTNATMTVTGSTFGNNSARYGGGIYNGQTATVTSSTFSGNSGGGSNSGGGGGIDNNGPLTITSSIVAGNTTATSGPDLRGTFTSHGHNLVGKSDGSTGFTNGVNGDIVGTASAPVDPQLLPLANYGGPTRTQLPHPSSPAIDAGDDAVTSAPLNLTTDQRGLARKVGAHVDIGADEFQDADIAGGVFQFSAASYTVGEGGGHIDITVTRTDRLAQAAAVDFATADNNPNNLQPCSATGGNASSRCDYEATYGTLQFAPNDISKTFTVLINEDAFVEGAETLKLVLSNPAGNSALGQQSTATLQITDDDTTPSTTNPIDGSQFFVTQHYHDFLNREPDASGLQFWTNEIEKCGQDAQCREVRRINVSAAFFLSIEFQETGFLVERIYKTAYGDAQGTSSLGGTQHPLLVPVVRLDEFLRDTQEIGSKPNQIVVGQGNWQQQLAENKNAFALAFVQRARFASAFPSMMTAEQFVGALNTNAGGVLTAGDIAQLEAAFGGPEASSNDASKRAQALRSVAENAVLSRAETNRAFVLMQYFGYLRRNPNDAPDADYTGYDFWLSKLNQFGGDFIKAEMVKAFISSDEYRHRFGQ